MREYTTTSVGWIVKPDGGLLARSNTADEARFTVEELNQLLRDVLVLQAEVNRWRDECGTKQGGRWMAICPDEDGRYYEKMPEADATDNSGALTRWSGGGR